MSDLFIGTSAYSTADESLLKEAGIGWVRQSFAVPLMKSLHADPNGPINYCGIDCYFGTWDPGGPENWAEVIDELYEVSGVKVSVDEWGYSSAGKDLSAQLSLAFCILYYRISSRSWRADT